MKIKIGWLIGLAAVGAGAAVLSSADKPKPSNSPGEPPKAGPTPTPEPWIPEPYLSYPRGSYTIDLTGLSTGVRWRVFRTSAWQSATSLAAKDLVKIAAGIEEIEDEARAAADAFVDVLPVLPVPQPTEPMDGSAAPPPPGVASHGAKLIDCGVLVVDDLITWVAWASPRLAKAAATMGPGDVVASLFSEAWPECVLSKDITIEGSAPVPGGSGVTIEDTIAEVAPTLQAVREGKVFPQVDPFAPSPIEQAAAALVGMDLGAQKAPAFAHRGWVVEIRSLGKAWRWKIRRPDVAVALRRGVSNSEQAAVLAAKNAVPQA